MRNQLFLFVLILSCISCNDKADTLFTGISAKKSGIIFRNTLKELPEFNVLKYGYFYNGGGVALGDINNDGLCDIYFTGNLVASHLYLNQGEWEFSNIAKDAGVEAAGLWNTGVNMVDINDDGWLDIYVCRSAAKDPDARRNLLFINKTSENGEVIFEEQGAIYGLNDQGYSTQSAFFDFDKDGDLDMYLLNHSVQEFANFSNNLLGYKNRRDGDYGDKLYRNDGNKFTDISKDAGIKSTVLGFGLGVSIGDFNNDTWPDIYVSNDYNEEDYLYINDGNGSFSEQLRSYLDHTSLFSMGSDAADINNDGMTDVVTLDMLPSDNYRIKLTSGADNFDKYQLLLKQGFYKQNMRNMLHLNEGGAFSEVGQLAGISNTDWSWSALLADYDLDGLQDLFVTNGYLRDYTNMDFMSFAVDMKLSDEDMTTDQSIEELLKHMPKIEVPNQVFRNVDGVRFEDHSAAWGFNKIELSNGAAYADLDNDGDLDLVVNNVNDFAGVYRNQAVEKNQGNFLKITLVADSITTIGSKVCLFVDDEIMTRELYLSRGYQSSVEPTLHWGLGKNPSVDALLVRWSDGTEEQFDVEKVNTEITLEKGSGFSPTIKMQAEKQKIFKRDNLALFEHVEDDFNDFRHQSLLPTYYSRNGPSLVVGDLNGDELDDLICGGAAGQQMGVFLGDAASPFREISQPAISGDAQHEDVALALADLDGDEDLDLVAASGGNFAVEGEDHYPLRIYLNNGLGQFKRSEHLTEVRIQANTLALGDYDADGDIDVFVGGQYEALNYPKPNTNYLLLNDGQGVFSDMQNLPFASNRVASVVAEDINVDGRIDLVMAGEWEGVEVWSFDGHWQRTYHYPLHGWYSSVHPLNLDGDRELEIVVGNWGLNSQLQASQERPMVVYSGDFDDNGTIDPILSTYMGDQSYPFVSRDDLLGQLPGLKKHFTSYADYGKYTMDQLLELLPIAKADSIVELASFVLDVSGDSLISVKLPMEAQVAPIYAITDLDVDGDGDQDLILAGNSIYNRVKIGEIDANHGVMLQNDGDLKFSALSISKTGLDVRGSARSVVKLTSNTGTNILFGINDDQVISYQLSTEEVVQ
ncbi:MAG: VCBS repeat-containing protein [Saprospiraceae bacterium]|nr:VCBS repeat-containing protein [Saprospiraceae bacterium]